MSSNNETHEAAFAAFMALGKALNGGQHKDAVAGIVEAIRREHRYLSNAAIWALLEALGTFGGLDNVTDARNESAHRACRDIRKVLEARIVWKN